MKSNKKFPPALGAIVDQALKDNTAWIGKTVLELTCEAIKKHGLSQEDTEGCVCLTVDEAKAVLECVEACTFDSEFEGFVSNNKLLRDKLTKQIEQAENK